MMTATAPVNDMAGRVLGGKYLVGEQLGSGGYGTVYAALQRDLNRPCAIKVLDGHVSDHDVARFEREARAAAALGHPHIVQVTDFSARPDEPPFLVMELLSGETLSSLMKKSGRVPAARVVAIASQVLAALDAAHRAGIVHRDVKPANVFLVANAGVGDFAKLVDFGIAKALGDATALTASGAMLGSPAYMAPEQVKGLNVDPRTDVYALGATMYHALSGRYPFDAPTVHALLYAIAESRPAALASLDASIDPRVVAVVERAMQKDPAARFQSAAEMRAALTMPAPAPAFAAPTPAPSSNVALIVALVGGAFVLAILGLGVVAFLWREEAAAPQPKPVATPVVEPEPPPAATVTPSFTAVVSAAPKKTPPATPKQVFAGTDPKFSTGTYRAPFKSSTTRPAIDAVIPSIKPCFVATELDAPDHRSTAWAVTVDPSGTVTSAIRKDSKNAHPKLDGCVTTAIRTMKAPATETGGGFEFSLFAPAKGDL